MRVLETTRNTLFTITWSCTDSPVKRTLNNNWLVTFVVLTLLAVKVFLLLACDVLLPPSAV